MRYTRVARAIGSPPGDGRPVRIATGRLLAAVRRTTLRNLPWRAPNVVRAPYLVLVSEIMLQQTQVTRVIPYFQRWRERWPTPQALVAASPAEVVGAWSGLGYNRRALALYRAVCTALDRWGEVPVDEARLIGLPGIGTYTAAAMQVFAGNQWALPVETNIRTALLLHMRGDGDAQVGEKEFQTALRQVVMAARRHQWEPREFFWRLMDYGALLKQQGVRLNARVRGWRPQGPFRGSLRAVRGAIVRALTHGPQTREELVRFLAQEGVTRASCGGGDQVACALCALERDGIIERRDKRYALVGWGSVSRNESA